MTQSANRISYSSRMAWANRRFVAKHAGLRHAMAIAVPLSLALWAALAHAVGLV